RLGFVLIFDEVKTGFRHTVGGYASIAGVSPDLAVYGKAVANGYPLAGLGGKKKEMGYFLHPDPSQRVLLGGGFNAHPVPTVAAIATVERLLKNGGEVYRHVEHLGERIQSGMEKIVSELDIKAVVSRQGSAFCLYFMDRCPRDWHDLASHHHFEEDER